MGNPRGPSNFSEEVDTDCGAYHVRNIRHAESSETYYYDIASGALVAIYWYPRCFGPPGGINVVCTPSATAPSICTLFGGGLADSDGGLFGDGGSPSCLAVDAGAIIPPPPLSWNAPCARDAGADAGAACYASCTLLEGTYKYVGCVSGSPVGTMCHASCSACP
jgi:hypothetical protein